MVEGLYTPIKIGSQDPLLNVEYSIDILTLQIEDKYGKTFLNKSREVAQIDALSYLFAHLIRLEIINEKDIDIISGKNLIKEEEVSYRFAINAALVSDNWKYIATSLKVIGNSIENQDNRASNFRQGRAVQNLAQAVLGRYR